MLEEIDEDKTIEIKNSNSNKFIPIVKNNSNDKNKNISTVNNDINKQKVLPKKYVWEESSEDDN